MTFDITADGVFGPGQTAPRGTYLCLESGLIHRLTRPASLPQGGPFRMIAPADVLGMQAAPVLDAAWPESSEPPRPEDEEEPSRWLGILALAHLGKAGSWW